MSRDSAPPPPRYPLEGSTRLSDSLLWDLQRRFFAQEGVQAWNTGKVPHYVSNTPSLANAYGHVLFGYLRDLSATPNAPDACAGLNPTQPVYIVELGAGTGRFAYHFLRQFLEYYPHSVLRHIPFVYVLTDFAQANLEFWRAHPRLQPFFDQGILDLARFDATQDQELQLLHRGTVLSRDSRLNPLIFIANYVFDSIPQDLFTIHAGQLYESRVQLHSPDPVRGAVDQTILPELEVTYEDVPVVPEACYDDPALTGILAQYTASLSDTAVLVPSYGLRCLRNLYELANGRLLMLSADKGEARLGDLEGRGKPQLTHHHGCFSLSVNYHALGLYIQALGGQAYHVSHLHRSLSINAFLTGTHPEGFPETQQAWTLSLDRASPDDLFAVKKALERQYDRMTLPELLAHLRLSGWDAHIFLRCADSLEAQAATASAPLAEELRQAVERIWENYYFIGEARDLPFQLASLLYALGEYARALEFWGYSHELMGPNPTTFYNRALCYSLLEQGAEALAMLAQSLAIEPDFTPALELQARLAAQGLDSEGPSSSDPIS